MEVIIVLYLQLNGYLLMKIQVVMLVYLLVEHMEELFKGLEQMEKVIMYL